MYVYVYMYIVVFFSAFMQYNYIRTHTYILYSLAATCMYVHVCNT